MLSPNLAVATQPRQTTQSKQRHPPTYAQAVSADLVKSAVLKAIQEHQKVITEKSSIVVYGFPEEGHIHAGFLGMPL